MLLYFIAEQKFCTSDEEYCKYIEIFKPRFNAQVLRCVSNDANQVVRLESRHVMGSIAKLTALRLQPRPWRHSNSNFVQVQLHFPYLLIFMLQLFAYCIGTAYSLLFLVSFSSSILTRSFTMRTKTNKN